MLEQVDVQNPIENKNILLLHYSVGAAGLSEHKSYRQGFICNPSSLAFSGTSLSKTTEIVQYHLEKILQVRAQALCLFRAPLRPYRTLIRV